MRPLWNPALHSWACRNFEFSANAKQREEPGTVGNAERHRAAVPLEVSSMRMPLLDKTQLGQNEHVRREPPGIQVPGKEVRHHGAVGGEMTRITIVGAALIVVAILAVLITIRAMAANNDNRDKTD